MKRLASMTLLAWVAVHAVAQPAAPWPDLPDVERVRAVVLALPEVQAANAARRADEAQRERLRAGPHEFNLRLGLQQRRAQEADAAGPLAARRYTEPQVSLERGLRLPGKARQDAAVGEAAVALGRLRRADAIHEASRQLLTLWFDWLREAGAARLWQEQVLTQQELLQRTEQRIKAGDAARSEALLQQASLAQATASRAAAEGRAEAVRAELAARFPELLPADLNPVAEPAAPTPATAEPGTQAEHLRRLVDDSHEWLLARGEATLSREQALRVSQERRGDPSVSIYTARERAGADRLVGAAITVPLGSEGRQAQARVALAQADESAQRAEQVRRRVSAEAARQLIAADRAVQVWQRQAEALASAQASLQAMRRGWQLGEYAVADVLLARRQQADAALAELTARADARHQAARLLLDLHELWEFDDE